MKNRFFAAMAIALVFTVGLPASAQTTPDATTPAVGQTAACHTISANGLNGVVNCIVGFMNTGVVLLMAAAVLYIIWGAFEMIRSEEKREEGKKTITYGIIGLFVMVSVWGLVNILVSTFGLNQSRAITPPSLTQ